MSQRMRYALIGAGSRGMTYMDALAGPHRDHAELVSLCDPSPIRMAWHNERLAGRFKYPPHATYGPDGFDRMIA